METIISEYKTNQISAFTHKLNGFLSSYKKRLKTFRIEAFIFFISVFFLFFVIACFFQKTQTEKLDTVLTEKVRIFKSHFEAQLEGLKQTVIVTDPSSPKALDELAKEFDSILIVDANLNIKRILSKTSEENSKTNFNDLNPEQKILNRINDFDDVKMTYKLEVLPGVNEINFIRMIFNNADKEFLICSIGLDTLVKKLLKTSPNIKIVIYNEESQQLYSSYKSSLKQKRAMIYSSKRESIEIAPGESLHVIALPKRPLQENYINTDLRVLTLVSAILAMFSSIIFFKLKANALKNKLIKMIFYWVNRKDHFYN